MSDRNGKMPLGGQAAIFTKSIPTKLESAFRLDILRARHHAQVGFTVDIGCSNNALIIPARSQSFQAARHWTSPGDLQVPLQEGHLELLSLTLCTKPSP